MKTLIALVLLALSASAQTKVSLAQVTDKPAPVVRLVMMNTDGSSQTVTLGAGLAIVSVPGAQFPEIRATAAVPLPQVTRNVGVKLVRQSDGTWAPGKPLLGKLIVSTLQVTRNGVIQDDTDYAFDGSNNSVKFIPSPGAIPPADGDKIAMSVDAQ